MPAILGFGVRNKRHSSTRSVVVEFDISQFYYAFERDEVLVGNEKLYSSSPSSCPGIYRPAASEHLIK